MKQILLFFLLLTAFNVFTQSNSFADVYLNDGSIVQGTIIEQAPNVKTNIQTMDREVFVNTYDEIGTIIKETSDISLNYTIDPKTPKTMERYQKSGIACSVLGSVFLVGVPVSILAGLTLGNGSSSSLVPGGAIASSVILFAAAVPLLVVGPKQIAKYRKMFNGEDAKQSGIYVSPSIQFIDDHHTTVLGSSNKFSVGGSVIFKL